MIKSRIVPDAMIITIMTMRTLTNPAMHVGMIGFPFTLAIEGLLIRYFIEILMITTLASLIVLYNDYKLTRS